jgi:hypothetical protein
MSNVSDCLQQISTTEFLASHLDRADLRYLDLGKVTHGSASNTFLECAGIDIQPAALNYAVVKA